MPAPSSHPFLFVPDARVARKLKYPDHLQARWVEIVLGEDEFGQWAVLPAGSPLHRRSGNVMRFHSHHMYCYPRDRWWVAHFWSQELTYQVERPDGTVVAGEVAEREYVDISTPPVVSATGLAFVDLTLDVGRRTDGSIVILDEDEVERDRVRWSVPDRLVEGAWRSCSEVFTMMRAGEPPFDEKVPDGWLDVFLSDL
jgi:hypothetical protein